MTAADIIRRAATAIRATADAAYPGPWVSDDSTDCWRLHSQPDPHFPSAQILKAPKRDTPFAEYWPDKPTAAHITAWHPGVALAVADWLDTILANEDDLRAYCGGICDARWCTNIHRALAVARAYLGEADA